METTRQQKIAKQIQKDVAEIFQKEGEGIVRGSLVTVTAVRVSPDFGYAKIYVSVFHNTQTVLQASFSSLKLLDKHIKLSLFIMSSEKSRRKRDRKSVV